MVAFVGASGHGQRNQVACRRRGIGAGPGSGQQERPLEGGDQGVAEPDGVEIRAECARLDPVASYRLDPAALPVEELGDLALHRSRCVEPIGGQRTAQAEATFAGGSGEDVDVVVQAIEWPAIRNRCDRSVEVGDVSVGRRRDQIALGAEVMMQRRGSHPEPLGQLLIAERRAAVLNRDRRLVEQFCSQLSTGGARHGDESTSR